MIIDMLIALLHAEAGKTPYVRGGHTAAGSDCSGLVSQLANIASGRDPFATRFATGTEEAELRSRGFVEGTAPHALVVGWNSIHTAATLPDGEPAESGGPLGGGVKDRGQGAYQAQFTHHMYLPVFLSWWTGEDTPKPKPPPPPVVPPLPPAPPPLVSPMDFVPRDQR